MFPPIYREILQRRTHTTNISRDTQVSYGDGCTHPIEVGNWRFGTLRLHGSPRWIYLSHKTILWMLIISLPLPLFALLIPKYYYYYLLLYKTAPETMMRALEQLNYLGALDDDGGMTQLGHRMSNLFIITIIKWDIVILLSFLYLWCNIFIIC